MQAIEQTEEFISGKTEVQKLGLGTIESNN